MRYADLADYCSRNPQLKERFIAESLGIDTARFSKLKSRKYGLQPDATETQAIAELLNQPVSHVRKLYARAA